MKYLWIIIFAANEQLQYIGVPFSGGEMGDMVCIS
jgi:hypothetical protein